MQFSEVTPNHKRKVRVTKAKATGRLHKGTPKDRPNGGLTYTEMSKLWDEDRPKFRPKTIVKAYGIPCAGCGITRPTSAKAGDTCDTCGTIYADTGAARVYIES